MQHTRVILALPLALALPGAALSQELALDYGATVTSNYIVDGLSESRDRPAIQPFAEVSLGGFYGGIWGSTLGGRTEDGDRFEINLYAGFRDSVGPLSYDLSYARYFYDNTGDLGGEILAELTYDIGDGVAFGIGLGVDPEPWALSNISGTAAYAFTDAVELSATIGRVPNSHTYWDAGIGVGLTDTLGLDLRYHDTDIDDGKLVVSLTAAFGL